MRKNSFIMLAVTLLLAVFTFSSCSKDDDPVPPGVDMNFVTFVNNSNSDVSVVVCSGSIYDFPTSNDFRIGNYAIQVVNAKSSKMLEDAAAKALLKTGNPVTLFVVNSSVLKDEGADGVRKDQTLYTRILLTSVPDNWTVTYPQ